MRLLYTLLFLISFTATGQSYNEQLLAYREKYKQSLMQGVHPLSAADTGYLRFFEPDSEYRVQATFELITEGMPGLLSMKHGGYMPPARIYGKVFFKTKRAAITLYVVRLFSEHEDYTGAHMRLFIPFNDRTNYHETFGGGRYLDISALDIKDNFITLDFNKCYNPRTAYEKGLPYLMPPYFNNLRIEIKAGEKIFGHNPGF